MCSMYQCRPAGHIKSRIDCTESPSALADALAEVLGRIHCVRKAHLLVVELCSGTGRAAGTSQLTDPNSHHDHRRDLKGIVQSLRHLPQPRSCPSLHILIAAKANHQDRPLITMETGRATAQKTCPCEVPDVRRRCQKLVRLSQ